MSAWADWRLPIQALSGRFRLPAPDLAGFGHAQGPCGFGFSRDAWLEPVIALPGAWKP